MDFYLGVIFMMIQFSNLSTKHGITTRLGGVSNGVYSQMNTSFFGEDDRESVFRNIKIALDLMCIQAKIIVATQQVHSNTIRFINHDTQFESFKSISVEGTALEGYKLYVVEETDGLITDRPDVVLMTFYADCVPILLFDEKKNIAASIHSGWRGTANGIAAHGIEMMVQFGSTPNDIMAAIGQCAGKCCYEVDGVVIRAFGDHYSQQERKQFVIPKSDDKYWLDLKCANSILLQKSGILQDHIEVNQECTLCNPEKYHSHRRTGYPRGSMSAFIQVK